MPELQRKPSASSLIADPLGLGRFGSSEAVIRHVLLAPDVRSRLQHIEREMLKMEQVSCPVVHRFGPGIYIREITMPAGAFVIGARHKREQFNIMLKGRVTVLNDNGSMTELVAPMAFVGKPGQKVGYVHEEVVWQNVYATDETDIEALEARNVDKGDMWRDLAALRKSTLQDEVDRLDYIAVLSEWGIPHAVALAQSRHTGDMMPFPLGSYKVMVSDSTIDGRGLFATADIEVGEVIAPARIGEKRTPAGRYTNHSARPNARFELLQNGDLSLVAIRQIHGMRGGMPGDEITIDYRQALEIRSKQCPQQSLPQ